MEEDEDSNTLRQDNIPQMARFRDALLDLLAERAHDVSPYTRSAVLKAWCCMLEAGSVPVRRVGTAADVAADRLQDKNALVRKSAASLLTSALEHNPFAGSVEMAAFEAQKENCLKLLEVRKQEILKEKPESDNVNEDEENQPTG